MSLPQAYLDEFAEPLGYLDFAATGPVSRRVRRGDWVRLAPHATTRPEAAGLLAAALGSG